MSKIQAKECQNVEYKSSWHDKYLAWICGFANAQGAVMYFGVDDDHEVVGLEHVDTLMEDIPNKIVNFMGLVVDVNLHEQDGLDYIEVVIDPSNVPISFKGKYYYRSGSTMQELNGAALQQFILKKMGRSWDDYTGPDIQMHVYNDQIEIWNEGTLPEGYDEKVLYSKHSSKPRNRNIADTMFKAGFIDTWGRGYKKIHDGFEAAGLPMPKVQNFCGGVQVTIERTKFMQMSDASDNGGSFGGSGGSLAVARLSARQKRICETIQSNPKVTVEQMTVALSVAKRTLERELAALQKMGVLVREGNTSAGHWVII